MTHLFRSVRLEFQSYLEGSRLEHLSGLVLVNDCASANRLEAEFESDGKSLICTEVVPWDYNGVFSFVG